MFEKDGDCVRNKSPVCGILSRRAGILLVLRSILIS
jgi:hypothetical protein